MAFSCPHCAGEIDQGTINDRMKDLTTRVKTAEAAALAAEKLAETHASLAEKAKADLTEGLAAKDAEYSSTIAFTEANIKEPDVREAFQWQYGKLAEDARLPFGEQIAAWVAKPEEAPVLLRPFLAARNGAGAASGNQAGSGAANGANAAGGAAGAASGAGGKAAPNVNAGTQTRTDGGGAFQAGSALKAVGDGTYRANRDALYASAGLGKPPPLPGGGT
ncbi:MAG: hypothetical protein Q8P18_18325 [Pseudomonadota bacterium]|nr:hypothetical protein [Pseudomonadota bacterium]